MFLSGAAILNFSRSAARRAQVAEAAKAVWGLNVCHSQPNRSDAGRSMAPLVRLNQPKAVPASSGGIAVIGIGSFTDAIKSIVRFF